MSKATVPTVELSPQNFSVGQLTARGERVRPFPRYQETVKAQKRTSKLKQLRSRLKIRRVHAASVMEK